VSKLNRTHSDAEVRRCDRWEWCDLIASERGPSDSTTRLVLFVLSLHMNQSGERCFPSQKLIAVRAGLTERSVRTHLGHAIRARWLQSTKRKRKGKAWYVNEYEATIPAELVEFCPAKPWLIDPGYRRAEDISGRAEGEDQVMAQRQATDTEDAAIHAVRRENKNTTTGKMVHNDRNGFPTNSSSNSSINISKNTPIQRAVASESAYVAGSAEKSESSKDERFGRIKKIIEAFPDYGDGDVAKVGCVSVQEVQEFRAQRQFVVEAA
jgi:hypothetical protein